MQKKFLELIKEKNGENYTLAHVLAENLSISLDSAYRRIREEIPLTFVEIVKLCKTHNISFDKLISLEANDEDIGFKYSWFPEAQFEKNFLAQVNNMCMFLSEAIKGNSAFFHIMTSRFPFYCLIKYPKLLAFSLDIWAGIKDKPNFSYIQNGIPDSIKIAMNYLSEQLQQIATILILNPRWISAFLENLSFYLRMGLLNLDELLPIKEEMLLLLDNLEADAKNGKKKDGMLLELYVSRLSFEGVNGFLAFDNKIYSIISLHEISYMVTSNRSFGQEHERWTNYIQNNAVCISGSGAWERKTFFDEQRKIVENFFAAPHGKQHIL